MFGCDGDRVFPLSGLIIRALIINDFRFIGDRNWRQASSLGHGPEHTREVEAVNLQGPAFAGSLVMRLPVGIVSKANRYR